MGSIQKLITRHIDTVNRNRCTPHFVISQQRPTTDARLFQSFNNTQIQLWKNCSWSSKHPCNYCPCQ